MPAILPQPTPDKACMIWRRQFAQFLTLQHFILLGLKCPLLFIGNNFSKKQQNPNASNGYINQVEVEL
jgi:hypothetical protein